MNDIKRISLNINQLREKLPKYFGKFIIFTGDNGIGKSTLFHNIFQNQQYLDLFGTSYLLSQNWVVPELPVWHLVEMMLQLHQQKFDTKLTVSEHLTNSQLENHEYQILSTLSGGELQRLRLSFLDLVRENTSWWLLDEPFIGLDIHHQKEFLNYLINNNNNNNLKTLFLITHDVSFILEHALATVDLVVELVPVKN